MLSGLTASVGARVSVFPPNVSLLPDEHGFNVAPNTKMDVALTHRAFWRLPDPYTSRCIRDWNETLYTGTLTHTSVYSIQVRHRVRPRPIFNYWVVIQMWVGNTVMLVIVSNC